MKLTSQFLTFINHISEMLSSHIWVVTLLECTDTGHLHHHRQLYWMASAHKKKFLFLGLLLEKNLNSITFT